MSVDLLCMCAASLQLVLSFSVEALEDGDYMFCFDNTFSSMSEKLVFFELILDNMDTEEDPDSWKEHVIGIDTLDMKLEDIMVRQTFSYDLQLKRFPNHPTVSLQRCFRCYSIVSH